MIPLVRRILRGLSPGTAGTDEAPRQAAATAYEKPPAAFLAHIAMRDSEEVTRDDCARIREAGL